MDASIKSKSALPRGNMTFKSIMWYEFDQLKRILLKMNKQQKAEVLNLLNWVKLAVRNLTLRVNEATVCVNAAEMNSYASRAFVSYRLNNCGPFILFIKVQCMFASLHLQGSCRKASCSSSRESPMLFKAVMNMKKQYCLLSSSNCFTHHASC